MRLIRKPAPTEPASGDIMGCGNSGHTMRLPVLVSEKVASIPCLKIFSVLFAHLSIHPARSLHHSFMPFMPPPSLSPIKNRWRSPLQCSNKTPPPPSLTTTAARQHGPFHDLGEVWFILSPPSLAPPHSPSYLPPSLPQHTHFLSHAASHRGGNSDRRCYAASVAAVRWCRCPLPFFSRVGFFVVVLHVREALQAGVSELAWFYACQVIVFSHR